MDGDLFVGLMSGTSADAIDAALVSFGTGPITLLDALSIPLSPTTREAIAAASAPGRDALDAIATLDVQLAILFAETAMTLLAKAGVAPEQVTAIGSHGQTVRHRPSGPWPFTWQLGDPNIIAERTGITTVADFRRRDVAAGGQGAPLVPAFHRAIFGSTDSHRLVVNIGGIANVTLLHADGRTTGFDCGPGNTLLDAWVQQERQLPYDRDGAWARSGRVNQNLLTELLGDAYFTQPAPKSTGKEYFNLDWLKIRSGGLHECASQDTAATLTELTARTIVGAIEQNIPASTPVFVCGGGAYNLFLMERLAALWAGPVNSTGSIGLDPRWVEAAAFAWLARQTMTGFAGNIPEVTGASGYRLLGGIYPGKSAKSLT